MKRNECPSGGSKEYQSDLVEVFFLKVPAQRIKKWMNQKDGSPHSLQGVKMTVFSSLRGLQARGNPVK